jgi:4-amino-4-deoxy-L-arabinose transferase-like glycosyltransferase
MPPSTAPQTRIPKRPLANTLLLLALWIVFYASFTLMGPALLDDADSVHAEVAREMLLRHDWVTLYANGIRYLEKAPLLYWSMAASFKLFGVSAAAARIPLALTVLALAFAVESFVRRAFRSTRAGLYAALILLSSFGFFIFTRILLPDAMVCLWLTLALLCFWLSEECSHESVILSEGVAGAESKDLRFSFEAPKNLRWFCYAFAACCALGVLTKGLIGGVFPVAIVLIYLLLTRGPRAAATRIRQIHPLSSLAVFLLIAAPWHILIALANPAQGHPGGLTLAHGAHSVPLPTQGNVHGWLWFYFLNEQILRYVNLRVPRDYDTAPLGLFWGLCLVWLMPWSAFVFSAIRWRNPLSHTLLKTPEQRAKALLLYRRCGLPRELHAPLLLILWALVPLLFFSFSTRQEYYVLPALPPLAILIAGWLAQENDWQPITDRAKILRRANLRATAVLLALGAIFAAAAFVFLLRSRASTPSTDLASLLQQNPADYALSMGHFLDLNAAALGLFRLPLALAATALFLGPLASFLLRKKDRPHTATLALAAGAFGFLLATHLGLQIFAPVLGSQQLAAAIAPQLTGRAGEPPALIVIHQEYEFASTLGFYLQRPDYSFYAPPAYPGGMAHAIRWPRVLNPIHILTDPEHDGIANYGRSSNLWYGSFFRDAPPIFETPQSLAAKWPGQQRIFLWQDLANQPSPLPALPGPIYVITRSGGKEIVSNQRNTPPEILNTDLHR